MSMPNSWRDTDSPYVISGLPLTGSCMFCVCADACVPTDAIIAAAIAAVAKMVERRCFISENICGKISKIVCNSDTPEIGINVEKLFKNLFFFYRFFKFAV